MSKPTPEGFEAPNTTPVPDIVFDKLLSELTGNELKVLLYIIRRTYGFGKNADAISLSQFRRGIKTKDKKVLDKGCGIEHNRTILVALASLEKKGYVIANKGQTTSGDADTTIYKLRFKIASEAAVSDRVVTSGNHVVTPGNEGSYPTSPPWLPQVTRVVTPRNPQETVLQDTVKQETESQEREDMFAVAHTSHARIVMPLEEDISLAETIGHDFERAHHVINCAIWQRANNGTCADYQAAIDGGLHEMPTEPRIEAIQQTVSQSEPGDDRGHPQGIHTASVPASVPLGQVQRAAGATVYKMETDQPAQVGASVQAKPRRTRKKQADIEEIPEEAIRILDEWDVLMKRACPRTPGEKGTIAAALSLLASHPTIDDLREVWKFCFASNAEWYRAHGVTLQDIAKNFGKWQSLQVQGESPPPDSDRPPSINGLAKRMKEQMAARNNLQA